MHILRSNCRVVILLVIAMTFFRPQIAAGQTESYIVTAADSSVGLYDLATSSFVRSINAGSNPHSVAVSPNQRLAFVGSEGYVSVVDLTIGREIKRIQGIYAPEQSAFTPDGKLLLIEDYYTQTLDVIDTAALRLVRKVKLAPVLAYGANGMSSIVVVGRKAYVTTFETDYYRPTIAVVDLATFTARAIRIPGGYFYGYGISPNAAATPDGKYVVMVEDENNGGSHVLLISTASNLLTHDYEFATDPMGILITPVNKPGSIYGYVVGSGAGGFSTTALDLNSGSPTFGQLLPATKVIIDSIFRYSTGAAINAEGSRLVVTGHKNSPSGPQPDAVVIDTALMFTDPNNAIVGTATVAAGAPTRGVTIASVVTTPPGSAPSVTGVSGNITNDAPHTIHVSGSNFASGALVRIGSMAPLTSQVNSPTDLEVTIPQNAPAAAGLDVIVTNPGLAGPPAQQNQSGLLAKDLTIFATSAWQPDYQFGSLNNADGSISVFDFSERLDEEPSHSAPSQQEFGF
jgi:hypothetical protein